MEVVVVTAEGGDDVVPPDADPETLAAALRVSLVSGECDVVVHDARDLPWGDAPEILLAAVPRRFDARDIVIGPEDGLAGVRDGARVGSAPLRAAAQVASSRDAVAVLLEGDASAWLERLDDDLSAVIVPPDVADSLALGRREAVQAELDEVIPAAGQGAFACEVRADAEPALVELVRRLDDPDTHAAVAAERAVIAGLDASPDDCVAAHASVDDGVLTLHTRVTSRSGRLVLTDIGTGLAAGADAVGVNAARLLLGRGAARVMRSD